MPERPPKDNRRKPINSSADPREAGLPFLAEAMASRDPSDAILHQEARGQLSFVNSDTLPVDMDEVSRAALEAAGIKFGEVVEGDDIFRFVNLPDGWKKVPTDHSMWSKIVDEQGRERAAIFYKAAFYDRSAHLTATQRFDVSFDYDRSDSEGLAVATVTDGGNVIHTTEPFNVGDKPSYEVSGQANNLAIDWLSEKYPDWRNPAAYWDEASKKPE